MAQGSFVTSAHICLPQTKPLEVWVSVLWASIPEAPWVSARSCSLPERTLMLPLTEGSLRLRADDEDSLTSEDSFFSATEVIGMGNQVGLGQAFWASTRL